MLTGLEWEAKVAVDVVEAVAPDVLVIDVECQNLDVDVREDVLSVRGHFVSL
jgi:chemotaxis response regulator CheB